MVVAELPSREGQSPKERERMSEKELGSLLAAVGNHEGKALLLSSMLPGNIYFSSDLDRLMRIKQGEHEAWKISTKTPFDQCTNSFLPAKLVEVGLQGKDLRTYGYEKNVYGEEIGTALAGHILSFSERYPDFSLVHFFGSSHSNSKPSLIETSQGVMEYKQRSPIAHYRVFRALLRNAAMRETDLIRQLGTNDRFIAHHLERLTQHGIVLYESTRRDESIAHFKVEKEKLDEVPPLGRSNRRPIALIREVYEFIRANPDADISVDSLYTYIRNGFVGEPEETVRRKISYALHYMEAKGYLRRLKFRHGYQSELDLTSSQRQMLQELVEILDRFSSLDAEFLKEGRSKAYQITYDPRRFVTLLLKAKEASANANHANPEDTKRQILTILFLHPGITNRDIQEFLRKDGKDVSKGRVAQLTRVLREEARIRVHSKGAAYHYSASLQTT